MIELLSWPIVPSAARVMRDCSLPRHILTAAPRFRHDAMPAEVGVLLPTGDGPVELVRRVVEEPAICRDAVLGVFLAGPFLNVSLEAARLARAGVAWVANLPSVVQQDTEFAGQLADVGLDAARERAGLEVFQAAGFKTAAVVADAEDAVKAARLNPDAMIVMPRIADFAAGFPSLRQRSTAVRSVADSVASVNWRGLLLGLGERRDAASEALWPDRLDALLCRPEPVEEHARGRGSQNVDA